MNASLRTVIAVAVIALVSLSATATAFAGGNDYGLSAAPQSQFVAPGEDATISWRAWNNTDAASSCEVSIQELGLTVFSGVIQPKGSSGGQVSTPPLHTNSRFTLMLTCGGSLVSKRAVNVKIR